jgi:crotonobetainyl-CoA:carnitine CoA-transferase CaiB-like acyl-CoA transferase
MAPLEGVRVLEIGSYIAGPLVGTLLGDMGAEIIRIEKPKTGDESRATWSTNFRIINRNTKSITLNLSLPEGQRLFRDLAKKSDIVIENLTPGTMKAFNCSYDELKLANPMLIMVSVSGYGQSGPYRLKPAFNANIQAMGGLMSLTGFPNGPPIIVPNHIADYLAALFAVYGVMTALYYRTKSGKGQYIDVSMMDSMAFTVGDLIVRYLETGEKPVRSGSKLTPASLSGAYQASDGNVVITAHGRLWKFVAETMARKEFAKLAPGLHGPATEEQLEAEKALAVWVKERTVSQVMEALEKVGVPCVPVLTIDQLAQNEHFLHRNMLVEINDKGKTQLVSGVVPKLSESPGEIRSATPELGSNNEEIFIGLLGLDKSKLKSLEQSEVI